MNNNPEVKISTDEGVHWSDDLSPNIPGEPRWIPRVVTHPSDPNTMYIVRSGLSENNKIYKTTDLGNTWANISGDLPNLPCWDLFVDPHNIQPNNTNHLYAGMDVGVYRSIDGGISWQYISEDIPLLPVWDFDYVEYGSTAKLRVGSYGRSAYETEWSLLQFPSAPILIEPINNAILSTDTAQFVWQQSYPEVTKYWFEIDTTDHFSALVFSDSTITDTTLLFTSLSINKKYWWRVKAYNASGWGNFSEVRTFDIISSVESEETNIEFALGQNYPNPFNPITSIKYSIPNRSNVVLKIYDILGTVVTTLVNEEKEQGVYTISFDASNLASGLYLYQIQAGSFIDTKKMILLK